MKKTQRQIQKENTRKKILDAAYSEFGKKGILATTTSDVAKAADVSHGTVFSHFKSQEELICAVIEDFGHTIGMRTHELAQNSATVKEVLKAHLQCIKEYEQFYTKLIIEEKLLPKDIRNTFIVFQSALSFHLSNALNKEIQNGTIINVPIPLIFNTWIGLINYYLTNSDLFAPGESVIERYENTLINYFLKLIQTKNNRED